MTASSGMDHRAAGFDISVLTLVRDRQPQLDRFIEALGRQQGTAFELVISSMQETPPTVADDLPFAVQTIKIAGNALPLAAARNRAAYHARGSLLIFLDVDCLAAPDLVASYARALLSFDACLMGDVSYLPAEAVSPVSDYVDLAQRAVAHPARPVLGADELRPEPNARCLWGLSFGLRRSRFLAAGGFDPGYIGYGGEETDFAMRLASIDTPFAWLGQARALHQWHAISRPPLNHFHAIIANAKRFRRLWGSWCLEYWLQAFVDMGLITWSLAGERIDILREPSLAEQEDASRAGDGLIF